MLRPPQLAGAEAERSTFVVVQASAPPSPARVRRELSFLEVGSRRVIQTHQNRTFGKIGGGVAGRTDECVGRERVPDEMAGGQAEVRHPVRYRFALNSSSLILPADRRR